MPRRRIQFLTIIPTLTAASVASAEGTNQLNDTQALRQTTQAYVDTVGDGTESIRWVGLGSVTVSDPLGAPLATLTSGQSVTAESGAGAYKVVVNHNQSPGTPWDIAVIETNESGTDVEQLGRLFSYDWKFNAGGFSSNRATMGSFYALVPGGSPNTDAIIELKLDGLAGYVFNLSANRIGVDGELAGRSVPESGNYVTPEFPIYINPPNRAAFGRVSPEVSSFGFSGGVDTNALGEPIVPCNEVVPGETQGRFSLSTNVEGTYHIECDLDRNGTLDGGQTDLLLVGTTVPGPNLVPWDGVHAGLPVALGSYDCTLRVNVGEFHYVARDIETSYPGMRVFELQADGTRTGLNMHWNDGLLQQSAQTMPNGAFGLETGGPGGLFSGNYFDSTGANVNARSWGAFNSGGKGNRSLLDTYVWLESTLSTVITVAAVDGQIDSDGDGLSDYDERCSVGSDPAVPDADGDGQMDGEQYGTASSGTEGGLESHGRMSSALARRAIERTRMTPGATFALNASTRLSTLVPDMDNSGLISLSATPSDLVSLTNALDVYAVDYVSQDGQGTATLLMIETQGELYEHDKASCDRAGGSELVDVDLWGAPVGNGLKATVLSASYRNRTEATRDHTASFKLYDQPSGGLQLHSQWLRDAYPKVMPQQKVVNVQLWASNEALARRLLSATMSRIDSGPGLQNSALPVVPDDEDFDAEHERALTSASNKRDTVRLPGAYLSRGDTLGQRISLNLRHLQGDPEATLRISFLEEDGLAERQEFVKLEDFAPWTHAFSPFLDATVELLLDGEVADRMWLSDGSWAAYDDGIWGGDTDQQSFSTSDCTPQRFPAESKSPRALYLAGCAASLANIAEFGGVARHLATPLATSDWSGFAFYARSEKPHEICLEDTASADRSCLLLPASPAGRWFAVPFEQLRHLSDSQPGVPEQIRLVTFASKSEGTNRLEIAGLTLLTNLEPQGVPLLEAASASGRSSGGCSLQPYQNNSERYPWEWLLALAGGITLRTRRERRVGKPQS